MFSPVPGAFETPYQSAPLDIATECFFFARKDAIEERLEQIKQGKAAEILAETDDKHRETQTMCVGVRWNDFSRQDLIDIVTVRFIIICCCDTTTKLARGFSVSREGDLA